MDIKIGDCVEFRCFDGSIIDVRVVDFDGSNVIGVSPSGSRHWCPFHNVIKKKRMPMKF